MARPREGNLRSFFDATDLNKVETKGVQERAGGNESSVVPVAF